MADRNLIDLMIKARTPSWQRAGKQFTDIFLQTLQGGLSRKATTEEALTKERALKGEKLGRYAETKAKQYYTFDPDTEKYTAVPGDIGAQVKIARKTKPSVGVRAKSLTEAQEARVIAFQNAAEAGEYTDTDTKKTTIFNTEADLRNFKKQIFGTGVNKPIDEKIEPSFNKYKELDKTAKNRARVEQLKIKFNTTQKRFKNIPEMKGKELRGLFVEGKGYEVYEKGKLIGYYK